VREPIWIELVDCLAIHEKMLTMHGGLPGLRDQGLLESALHRPLQRHVYGSPTLFDLAAAYATGIVKNHPFLDGNKRAGFLSAAFFLELNGMAFVASEEDVVLNTLALAAGELDEAGYAAWLKKSCRRKRAGKSR
jgi:death on curing protein